MEQTVFLSYNRQTSSESAKAIHRELGEIAFLDTSDIEVGGQFASTLREALLDSSVVVVLANDVYFSRWYCLRELRVARALYDTLLQRESSTEQQLDEALQHIVVALPPDSRPSGLRNLPPLLQQTNWPTADNASAVAAEVLRRLSRATQRLRDRLSFAGAFRILDTVREESALPPPANFSGIRTYHPEGQLAPSIGDRFVGRANDLELIHFQLSTTRGAPSVGAALSARIAATGGFGKTRMAIEYVWRYGPAYYPGGCFWIDADTDGPGLEGQLYGIWKELKRPDPVPELAHVRQEGKSVARLVAEAVAEIPKTQPMLLVVDNIPESDPGAPARSLRQFCPALGLVTVLATSRQATVEDGTKTILLRSLPRTAALQLLKHDLSNAEDLSRAEWEKVANWVGDMPLALDLLNRSLYLDAVTPQELAKLSETGSQSRELDSLVGAISGEVPQNAVRGVTEALLISVEKLDESARKAAQLLAQFAAVSIPVQLVQALGPPVDEPKSRATLKARNFVTGGGGHTYGNMHRVLGDFLRQTAGPGGWADFLTACKAVSQLMTPQRCRNPVEWPLMNQLRPHALWLFERALTFSAPSVEHTPPISWLGMVAAILLSGQGENQESLQIRRKVYEMRKRVLGRDSLETLSAQYQFATGLQSMADYTGARELLEDLLPRARRIDGETGEVTLGTINALGLLEMSQGNLEKARDLFQTALSAIESIYMGLKLFSELQPALSISGTIGEFEQKRLTLMANLALAFQKQNKLQEARKAQENVLEARRRLFIPDDVETIVAMLALASTMKEMGDLAGAQKLERSARTAARKQLPSDHLLVVRATKSLAKTLRLLGENQLAETFEAEIQKLRPEH